LQEMLTSLSTYGYVIVFLYSLGGGMVAIIAAGVLAHLGKMDITVSIVLAAGASPGLRASTTACSVDRS